MIERRPHDGWVELRLDRPEKRNALSHALVDQLVAALDDAVASGDPVVVLAANGPTFCAGGDRSEIGTAPVAASARLLAHLRTVGTFVVARVEAPVLGAGVAVVRSCPVALGTPAVTFTLPEAAMGNFPVPAPYLAGTLAPRRIVEVAVLGSPVAADEAVAAGLLTRVVAPEDLDDAVTTWVDRLRSQPTVASQARRVWQRDLRNAHERSAWVEDMVRKDAAAAMAAEAAAEAETATAAEAESASDVVATGNGAAAGTHGDAVADGGVAS